MRKQYHFRPSTSGAGLDAWDVDRLIALSADLPVQRIPVALIEEVDSSYWDDASGRYPTVRQIAEHVELTLAADLRYPIILGWDGRVMDGMHRILRCLVEHRSEIDARRFTEPLAPDHVSIHPGDLPYTR